MLGQRLGIAALSPQLRRGLQQGTTRLLLSHGPQFRAHGRDSCRAERSGKIPCMRKTNLGVNGASASAVGLGCMAMSGTYGRADRAESIATIHAALDGGINLL